MNTFKGFLIAALIIFISASMAVGLELSASGGNNDGSSATTVQYGATEADYASQHVSLNPDKGTLSNAYSGSGSLPYASLTIEDGVGNKASVYRSITGKAVTTKWVYDWNTYFPTSSVYGRGVGAWLSLTATNAYAIYAGGIAQNSESDYASSGAYLGGMYSGTASGKTAATTYVSSISGYYVNPVAFSKQVSANQRASSATSTGMAELYSYSSNNANQWSDSGIYVSRGTITSPVTTATTTKTSAYSRAYASLMNAPYSNSWAEVFGYASNPEGDSSNFWTEVNYGRIGSPSITSVATGTYADTRGQASYAYGKTAEIGSQGLDTALGYQEHWQWNSAGYWDRIKTKVERGEGDFAAKRTQSH